MNPNKRRNIYLAILTLILFSGCCFAATPINPFIYLNNIFDPGEISRVYKFEISSLSTDQQIAGILIRRYLNDSLVGTLGWYKWISAYRIDNIQVFDAGVVGKTVEIDVDVRPVFHDSWEMINYSNDLPNGWIHIWWITTLKDERFYYELNGWYSG